MAKEDEKKPTAAEKGKAKAVNGEAEKEVKKDKDGKPIEDKKGVLPAGMFPRETAATRKFIGRILIPGHRGAQRGGSATQE
jgi:hypothetical protein